MPRPRPRTRATPTPLANEATTGLLTGRLPPSFCWDSSSSELWGVYAGYCAECFVSGAC